MKKTRFILTFLIFLFVPGIAFSANHYIRAGATGSNNGSNWTNAWNEMSSVNWSSVAAGDTVWVAGGTYTTTLTPAKSGTSGSIISIRRARSDAVECTGATGWSSGYDSDVHQTRMTAISIGNYNYITISGRKTAAGSTTLDNTANGWWIDNRGATSGMGVSFSGAVSSHITIEYMKLQGAGHINYTSESRGVDQVAPGGNYSSYNTLSHLEIFNWESGIYNVRLNNGLWEYLDVYQNGALNTATFHPDSFYTDDSSHGVLRYSKFHGNDGQMVFFVYASNITDWTVYGCAFYHNEVPWGSSGYATPFMIQAGTITYLRVYNNIFYNNWSNFALDSGGACGTGSENRNNIIFGDGGGITCGTASNNLTPSVSPFVNAVGEDYHIISTIGPGYPRNAGINLSAYFTKDMDGNTFGADGAWDIGAYELNSGSNPRMSPPKNPRTIP